MKTMNHFLLAIAFLCSSFAPQPLTWVAIGDSITYLNDHPEEAGNRVAKGYMSRVTEEMPHIKFVNQGHNGWTSAGIADKIDSLGLTPADIYSVFLGTNDWWQGRPIGTLSDYQNNAGNTTLFGSYRIIINKLRKLNDNAKIILITPLQRGDFVYINNMKNNAWGSYKEKNGQSLAQFSDAILAIASYERFEVADLYYNSGITLENAVKFKRLKDPQTGVYKNYTYPEYSKIPFDPEIDEYPYPSEATNMTYDGLHPSDLGNAVIADMLVKLMKK
jgi:lysophospholipase L1-like esterase